MHQLKKAPINYVCLTCHEIEKIPYKVVRSFDEMDEGDQSKPPMFSCEFCGGEMYPEFYIGKQGREYKITDIN